MKTVTKWLSTAALLGLLAGCGHEGNSTSALDQNMTDKAQDAAMASSDAGTNAATGSDMNAADANAGATMMNQADADTGGGASNASAGAMQ